MIIVSKRKENNVIKAIKRFRVDIPLYVLQHIQSFVHENNHGTFILNINKIINSFLKILSNF